MFFLGFFLCKTKFIVVNINLNEVDLGKYLSMFVFIEPFMFSIDEGYEGILLYDQKEKGIVPQVDKH